MSSTPSPPLTLQFFDFNTPPLRLFHQSLLEFEVMSSTPPHAGMIDFSFGADFGDFDGDFGASFGFDADFGGVFGNFAFADFFGILVDHHSMIRVVIAVDKEDGSVVVDQTDYSVLRV